VERASKLFVLASAIAAAILHSILVAREWHELPALLSVGAVLTVAAVRRWPSAVPGGLVAFGSVAAVVCTLTIGRFDWFYLIFWLACLLVGVLARPGLRWNFPPPWRFPLIGWALVLAVSWPIVVARELNFSPALLGEYGLLNPGVDWPPPLVALWIVHVFLIQIIGILWFDWLWGAYGSERRRPFERQILLPIGASVLVACGVGLYQGLVDFHWLSGGPWPALDRATGTLLDANVFGMLAALWAPVFVLGGLALVSRLSRQRAMWLGGGGLLIAFGGVWMSGSRAALLALAIGVTPIVAWGCSRVTSRGVRLLALGAAPVLVSLAFAALVFVPSTGPAERIRELVPPPSVEGVQRLAIRLWNRGWYGPAAHLMLREHPLVGVGIGSYHPLVDQYSRRAGWAAPFDNAQNWYRHQLAELGLIGSIPWILWVILFTGFLLTTRGKGEHRIPAAVVKGTLVALGVVSLVGVPAQSPVVTLMFWTFAFWYIRLAGASGVRVFPPAPVASDRLRWAAVLVVVTVYAAGTFRTAYADLRVPYRAASGVDRGSWRGAYSYHYGIDDPQDVGFADEQRRTGKRAVFNVLYPRGQDRGELHLKLSAWLEHPDAAEHPVQAKIWTRGRELVLNAKGWDGSRITRYVDIPVGHRAVVVETWVERTWREPGREEAESDDRGMTLAWEWVDEDLKPLGLAPE
jgi:hypothetical protein